MKLGMDHIGQVTNDKLKFLQQMGVEGVMAEPDVDQPGRGHYEFSELVSLRTQVESFGMKLAALSNNSPWEWSYKWMLGLPGRDEQIENCQKTLRHMGAAGIPVFTFNMHALRFYRTSRHTPWRGGAVATSFDVDFARNVPLMAGGPGTNTELVPHSHRRPISDDQMWANLTYFLKAVVPVAEEAGVKLGMHPDDPPIPSIGGVARIVRSPEAYRRYIEIVPSDNVGLLFCQGCFTEMGANVAEEIRYFGSRKKIFWVHFRNVKGTAERFSEAFPDDGQLDMVKAMKAYRDAGYEGYMAPDHKLGIIDDTEWGHRYWGYALGYMRGLLQAVKAI
jgi:mannonate dehydratase